MEKDLERVRNVLELFAQAIRDRHGWTSACELEHLDAKGALDRLDAHHRTCEWEDD